MYFIIIETLIHLYIDILIHKATVLKEKIFISLFRNHNLTCCPVLAINYGIHVSVETLLLPKPFKIVKLFVSLKPTKIMNMS